MDCQSLVDKDVLSMATSEVVSHIVNVINRILPLNT